MAIKMEKIFSQKDIIIKNKELANMINKKYKNKDLVLIGIMNGAFFFMRDIMKNISIDFQFDTISCSSYLGKTKSTGKVRYIYESKVDICGRNILIIEDIIDTGKTIRKILAKLKILKPKSIQVATLFLRGKNKINDQLFWYGFELKNEFIVGYGLDYDEKYRQLDDIYKINKI